MEIEKAMNCAFKEHTGQIPFAIGHSSGNKKRIILTLTHYHQCVDTFPCGAGWGFLGAAIFGGLQRVKTKSYR